MPSETNNKSSNSKMIGRWRMIESKYSEILEFYEYLVALGADATQAQENTNQTVQLLSIHNENKDWNFELDYLDSGVLIRNMKRFTEDVESTDRLYLGGKKCFTLVRTNGPDMLIEEKRDPITKELITTIVKEANENMLTEVLNLSS